MKTYPRRIKYKIGQKYHSFTIISEAPTIKTQSGRSYTCWKCKCDCGKFFTTTTKQIRKGVRKSCGCLSKSNRFKTLEGKDVITNITMGHYMSLAKKRSLVWKLTREQFKNIIFSDCYYCGYKPYILVKSGKHEERVNGIDRKDNTIGYTVENSVPCCKFCNMAKGASTLEEFEKWIAHKKFLE